jgi:uncharacterized membrane protein YbjE (DUF340 family)
MKQWHSKLENPIIKMVIVVLLGFGVGFLINHDWMNAVEAIGIGALLTLIYLLGKKMDKLSRDDEDQ